MREADRAGRVVRWKIASIYIGMHACMHGGLGNVGMHVWHEHECVMPAGTLPVQCAGQAGTVGQQRDAVQCAKACLCMHPGNR